jgi:hypothetical protein
MKQSEESSDSENETSEKSSVESDDDAPGPSKRVRTTTHKKQSDWNWPQTDNNPVIYPFSNNSGVSKNLFTKFESEPPSELSIFLEYIKPLFEKISSKTNAYATIQLNNPNRKN